MTLHALQQPAIRALGLIRVSKERDGMVSPEVQRVAITDYARARGYQVTGWLEGLDESGSQKRSAWWPRLEQAVAAVEAGQYDAVLVWKFSRTARNRLRWAVALDRVETAGGRLESATEQVDTTTSTGRFTRGMLAELNAFEAERIGEVWKEVQARRVREGLTHNGKPRAGYRYDVDAKRHEQDPEFGPVLADCYRRFVDGTSFYSLVQDLNARGHRTTAGGLWTDRSLRRAMDSGFAAGWVLYQGELHPGAHEPLIDEELWERYRQARRLRARVAKRSTRSPYLLSGLVRCGWCQGSMNAGTFGKARIPKYRCETRRSTAGAGCRGGMVSAALVHAEVHRWLEGEAAELDAVATVVRPREDARDARVRDAERLAREVTRLEQALVRLQVQHAEDLDGDPKVQRAAREALERRLGEARGKHDQAVVLAARLEAPARSLVRPLLDGWLTLQVEVRRELLRQLVGCVQVRTHSERGTPADVRVVPLWETPG